ncbi:ATP-dependent DNA ligase family profile domain-containing protein [Methylorubrum thiocyanatum]
MSKRTKSLPQQRGFVLFDVVYADGTRASNRRVPMEILGGLDGDEPARQLIAEQEAEIAQKAGRPPREIQQLARSPIPKPVPAT